MGLRDYGWMMTNYVFNQSMVTIVWLDRVVYIVCVIIDKYRNFGQINTSWLQNF